MLREVLFKHQDKKQLYIALIGSFIGIVFTLVSLHYLIKVNSYGEESDVLGPNVFIIQKKISSSNSLNVGVTSFNDEELRYYRSQSFFLDVKPINSNNFPVSFETEDPLVPYFRSDVFIQSVDTSFLDVHSNAWKWNERDTVVPIILPRDFLMMLNTFMSSSGIPLISDEVAMDIRFKLTLSNDKIQQHFTAKIIGFTNEVSSILVPNSFMEYGKNKFSKSKDDKVTQLMVEASEGKFGIVESFFKSHYLETKNAHLIAGRLKSMISILLSTILCISILTMVLSCMVVVQYVQLLISRISYEVSILLRIGYSINSIVVKVVSFLSLRIGLICLLSTATFFLVKKMIDSIIIDAGLLIDLSFLIEVWLVLLLIYLTFVGLTWLNAYRSVKKQF